MEADPSVYNSDSTFRFCKLKQGKSIMRRQEKKRKFHEAVLNMLYPTPPSPPSPQEEDGDGAQGAASGGLHGDRIPDEGGTEVGGSSASDVDPEDNEGECGEQKLTRAQRKRLRKKKLKEEIARRRKIVGPLLPPNSSGRCSPKEDDPVGVGEKEPPDVRRNAELGSGDVPHDREESAAFINQKRLQHRRAAKKLVRDRLKLSEQQNSN